MAIDCNPPSKPVYFNIKKNKRVMALCWMRVVKNRLEWLTFVDAYVGIELQQADNDDDDVRSVEIGDWLLFFDAGECLLTHILLPGARVMSGSPPVTAGGRPTKLGRHTATLPHRQK